MIPSMAVSHVPLMPGSKPAPLEASVIVLSAAFLTSDGRGDPWPWSRSVDSDNAPSHMHLEWFVSSLSDPGEAHLHLQSGGSSLVPGGHKQGRRDYGGRKYPPGEKTSRMDISGNIKSIRGRIWPKVQVLSSGFPAFRALNRRIEPHTAMDINHRT